MTASCTASIIWVLLVVGCTHSTVRPEVGASNDTQAIGATVRLATFNASLNRETSGALLADLRAEDCEQARNVAEVIQRVAPDILVLQEFDYDPGGESLRVFQRRYLATSQNGAPAINYPYVYQPSVNTGVATGLDLNRDGKADGPADAQGFGRHSGQYGFVILSKYQLMVKDVRTFQNLLWTSMPNARIPLDSSSPNGLWYSADALAVQRLSSKNHVDLPVRIGDREIHLLVAHPTPPVFDGPEDRNGRRNHDEIRLFADYLTPDLGSYLVDDTGRTGGLDANRAFVILGDMNADPLDGDSTERAIEQLLRHPRVHPAVAKGAMVPGSDGGEENARRPGDQGNPRYDTAAWGLRVDYVLPSRDLTVTGSGVFWPKLGESLSRLVGFDGKTAASSDHRLVWVDVTLP